MTLSDSGHQSSSIPDQTQSDAISHLECRRKRLELLSEGEGFVPVAVGELH